MTVGDGITMDRGMLGVPVTALVPLQASLSPLVEYLLVTGLVVLGAVVVVLVGVRKMVLYGSTGVVRGDVDVAESGVNCPGCGARNAGDRDACEHCGEPLADAA